MKAMRSPVMLGARAGIAALVLMAAAAAAVAQRPSSDAKPYDDKLMRLSEILGAIHYLRELCGANDGQAWRDRMKELMDTEGSSALRRARLTRSFNNGYRAYSRTYNACSPSAKTAITRFLSEGAEIADSLVKTAP
ncbi:MAG TPA: TIGR02301 family protein [Hyphomicrobiaceae bacterium]|nr:TIGR02301 family protein [Hyphomicrobiaceae bacterium]